MCLKKSCTQKQLPRLHGGQWNTLGCADPQLITEHEASNSGVRRVYPTWCLRCSGNGAFWKVVIAMGPMRRLDISSRALGGVGTTLNVFFSLCIKFRNATWSGVVTVLGSCDVLDSSLRLAMQEL